MFGQSLALFGHSALFGQSLQPVWLHQLILVKHCLFASSHGGKS